MKELSIEERAKRYDKALADAKHYYEVDSDTTKNVLEEIFPVLKENEDDDERIRKELLNAFQESEYSLYMVLTPHRRESFIAWLEKQYANPIKEYWRGYNEGKQNVLDKYAKLEKQGEHQHFNDNFQSFDEAQGTVIVEKQGEQKPTEWNQENVDELTDFENAMMYIGGSFFGKNAGLNPNNTNVVKEQANLLLGLVPSNEWSEEDEKMIENIIDTINMSIDDCDIDDIGTKARFSLEKERDWLENKLKSLKPQSTWKPSVGLT